MAAEKNTRPVSKDDRDVDVSSSLGVFLPEGLQEAPRLQLALGPAAHRVRGAPWHRGGGHGLEVGTGFGQTVGSGSPPRDNVALVNAA